MNRTRMIALSKKASQSTHKKIRTRVFAKTWTRMSQKQRVKHLKNMLFNQEYAESQSVLSYVNLDSDLRFKLECIN